MSQLLRSAAPPPRSPEWNVHAKGGRCDGSEAMGARRPGGGPAGARWRGAAGAGGGCAAEGRRHVPVDTTGSMSGAISEVRSEIGDVMQRVGDGVPDAAFGLAQMRDLDPDSGFSYRLEQG